MSTKTVITCEDCGHATPATTPSIAAYAMRRHSCTTVRERAARAQRRLDRLALSGPEQPCQHNDRHPHGNRVRYVIDKCRCRPCRDAAAAYTRDLKRRHLYGKVTYVPADPAREHVRALQAQGMGWKRVARAAGIDCSVMWKLLYGDPSRPQAPSKRIRPKTEAAILAVTLDLASVASVPGVGTRRRLQALVAIGWSQAKLAGRLGTTPANFGKVIHGHTTNDVNVATARAVTKLYDELWDQVPPHSEWRDHIAYTRALGHAVGYDWFVPMAWDEDDIDNPDAQPDRGQVEATRAYRCTYHVDDIEWLADEGLTVDGIAHRLQTTPGAIESACRKAGRLDLLDRILPLKDNQARVAS